MNSPSFFNLAMVLGLDSLALDEEFWQRACELRVAVPVVVVSFDAEAQTVVVQPAIMDTLIYNLVPTPTAIPPLPNIPVMFPRGGGFSITFPLEAGDEGVLVFSDMAIDSWWQSGGTQNKQVERRRHDLMDGMFFPTSGSQAKKLSNYRTDSLEVRSDDGQRTIRVTSSEIYITPDGGTTQLIVSPSGIALTGAVTVSGSLSVNSKDFGTHVHSGVTTGSGDTGPPV
jgi:hypothetical protein